MAGSVPDVPVHESLTVTDAETIYQAGDWWKAVVTYHYRGGDADETAVYMWHNEDDGWTRKNKYVIKTTDAWETDKPVIDRLFAKETGNDDVSDEFPTSDYYTVGAGVTVFQTDGWWKGILNITEKGTYETNEVMVYLWQHRNGEWKRRQKYTIKGYDEWTEEQKVIEAALGNSDDTEVADEMSGQDGEGWDELEMMETQALTGLNAELDDHLSGARD